MVLPMSMTGKADDPQSVTGSNAEGESRTVTLNGWLTLNFAAANREIGVPGNMADYSSPSL
jgi:hypothetical protein